MREHAVQGRSAYIVNQYDKRAMKSLPPVSIDDICCVDYLYEQRTPDGSVDEEYLNFLETSLGKVEGCFKSILNKILVKDVLSEQDIAFCYFWVASQFVRAPEMIDFSKDYLLSIDKKYIHKGLNEIEAGNMAKIFSVYHSNCNTLDDCRTEHSILYNVLMFIHRYPLVIWCTNKQFIMSDMNSVMLFCFELGSRPLWVAPVAYNRCIAVLNNFRNVGKSLYIDVFDSFTEFINSCIWSKSKKIVYSKVPISQETARFYAGI